MIQSPLGGQAQHDDHQRDTDIDAPGIHLALAERRASEITTSMTAAVGISWNLRPYTKERVMNTQANAALGVDQRSVDIQVQRTPRRLRYQATNGSGSFGSMFSARAVFLQPISRTRN